MSLRLKTILGIALIEAVLLGILITTALDYMTRSINEGMVKRANTTATLFVTTTKDAFLSYDLASLESFVQEVLKNPDMDYARILDSQGNLFAQGGNRNTLARPFSEDTHIAEVQDGVFDTFALIEEGGKIYGRVEIGLSVSQLHLSLRQLKLWTASIAGIEMGLVALFSFVLGTYLTRQLFNLRKGAKKIAKGVVVRDFNDIYIEESGKDELSEVARAFNYLVDNLSDENARREEYENQLQELNAELEQRVEQRTAELENRNAELITTNNELKLAQEQLIQSEKMASLGQLSAGIAHEINTPVGFVKSNLETLKEYAEVYLQISEMLSLYLSCQSSEERKELENALKTLIEEDDLEFISEDLNVLINDSIDGMVSVKDIAAGLKQFSHSQESKFQLVDVNSCINTTLGMVKNELKYHCKINVDLQPLPKITANSGKLCQVLTNLLVNAGHAIEDEGTITIQTQDLGEKVAIMVADTGKGIQENDLPHLFEPFFTTKEPGKGTGLGLAISYGIIKEHGGDIQVKSEPEKGTQFTLLLPVIMHQQENVA